jgi:hypothetical protein
VFDELFERVKYYAASGSFETPWDPLDAIFLALLLEQEKELRALRERVQAAESNGANRDLVVRSLPGA